MDDRRDFVAEMILRWEIILYYLDEVNVVKRVLRRGVRDKTMKAEFSLT